MTTTVVKCRRNADGTFSLLRDQVIATYVDWNECIDAFKTELSKDVKAMAKRDHKASCNYAVQTSRRLPRKLGGKGYKGHHIGSRLERVHREYDQHGFDKAYALGKRLKLTDRTLDTQLPTFAAGYASHTPR